MSADVWARCPLHTEQYAEEQISVFSRPQSGQISFSGTETLSETVLSADMLSLLLAISSISATELSILSGRTTYVVE